MTEKNLDKALDFLLKEVNKKKREQVAKKKSLIKRKEETGAAKVITLVQTNLIMLRRYDRKLLIKIYEEEFNKVCPPAPVEWIVEALARKTQSEAYINILGTIPDSVINNNEHFEKYGLQKATEKLKGRLEELQRSQPKQKSLTYFWN